MTSKRILRSRKNSNQTSKKNKCLIKTSQKSKTKIKKTSQKKMRGGVNPAPEKRKRLSMDDTTLDQYLADLGVIIELQDTFLRKLTSYLKVQNVETSSGRDSFEKIRMILKDVPHPEDHINNFIEHLKEAIGEQRYSQFLMKHESIHSLPFTPTDTSP